MANFNLNAVGLLCFSVAVFCLMAYIFRKIWDEKPSAFSLAWAVVFVYLGVLTMSPPREDPVLVYIFCAGFTFFFIFDYFVFLDTQSRVRMIASLTIFLLFLTSFHFF